MGILGVCLVGALPHTHHVIRHTAIHDKNFVNAIERAREVLLRAVEGYDTKQYLVYLSLAGGDTPSELRHTHTSERSVVPGMLFQKEESTASRLRTRPFALFPSGLLGGGGGLSRGGG